MPEQKFRKCLVYPSSFGHKDNLLNTAGAGSDTKPLDEKIANINGHEAEKDDNMMIALSSDEQEEEDCQMIDWD